MFASSVLICPPPKYDKGFIFQAIKLDLKFKTYTKLIQEDIQLLTNLTLSRDPTELGTWCSAIRKVLSRIRKEKGEKKNCDRVSNFSFNLDFRKLFSKDLAYPHSFYLKCFKYRDRFK